MPTPRTFPKTFNLQTSVFHRFKRSSFILAHSQLFKAAPFAREDSRPGTPTSPIRTTSGDVEVVLATKLFVPTSPPQTFDTPLRRPSEAAWAPPISVPFNVSATTMRKTKIFTGSSHPELAALIVDRLGLQTATATLKKFANQETSIEIGVSVRDEDVYIIQSGSSSVNDHLMELLIMVNACKISSAARITAVMPYFAYMKQSKKRKGRGAIAAKCKGLEIGWILTSLVVANMLTVAGVDHIITMDLHASQMQGFFSRPIDNLVAEPSIAKYIVEKIPGYQNGVVVSKSAGGAKRVTSLADRLKIGFALIHRERKKTSDGQPSRSALVGEVKGKVALLVDDIIDTVRNFIEAAEILQYCGAERVHVIATHGILSGTALAEIEDCEAIDEIIVTNTYPLPEWKRSQTTKLRVIDVSGVMAEAIRRTHNGESISYLFHTAV